MKEPILSNPPGKSWFQMTLLEGILLCQVILFLMMFLMIAWCHQLIQEQEYAHDVQTAYFREGHDQLSEEVSRIEILLESLNTHILELKTLQRKELLNDQ